MKSDKILQGSRLLFYFVAYIILPVSLSYETNIYEKTTSKDMKIEYQSCRFPLRKKGIQIKIVVVKGKNSKLLFYYGVCVFAILINNLKKYNEYLMGYSCGQSLITPSYV